MTVEIPEFRKMIEAGHRYLAGSCSIIELYGCASECASVARLFKAHSSIKATAEEWAATAYRRWNEWHDVKEPMLEPEFRAWLEGQLELGIGATEHAQQMGIDRAQPRSDPGLNKPGPDGSG